MKNIFLRTQNFGECIENIFRGSQTRQQNILQRKQDKTNMFGVYTLTFSPKTKSTEFFHCQSVNFKLKADLIAPEKNLIVFTWLCAS